MPSPLKSYMGSGRSVDARPCRRRRILYLCALQRDDLTGSNPPGSTLIEEYMGFDAVGSKSRSWRTGPGYTGTYRNVQCILCELYTLSLLTRALAQFVIRGHYPSPLLLGPTNRRARIVRPATGHEGVIDA